MDRDGGQDDFTYSYAFKEGSWEEISSDPLYKIKFDDLGESFRAAITYKDGKEFNEVIFSDEVNNISNSLLDPLYSSYGYEQIFGTKEVDQLSAKNKQVIFAIQGNDALSNNNQIYDQILIGGSGNDSYTVTGQALRLSMGANQGTKDTLDLSNFYKIDPVVDGTFSGSIDNKHIFAYDSYNDQTVLVIDGWSNNGIEIVNLGDESYSSTEFLNLLPTLPGYVGNVDWNFVRDYVGEEYSETARSLISNLKDTALTIESKIDDLNSSLSSYFL